MTFTPPPCDPRERGQASWGRWIQGKISSRCKPHINRGIVVEIAAFKVSHGAFIDKYTTALRAARARSSSTGALEERSRQGQKANTPRWPDSIRRWCWSAWPCQRCRVLRPVSKKTRAHNIPSGPERNCHRRFKCKTLTYCDAKITSTRTAAGQFKVVQWGNGGNVAEGSKCKHSHTATPESRARAQQPVSQRVGSRGRWNVTHGFDSRESSMLAKTHIVRIPSRDVQPD